MKLVDRKKISSNLVWWLLAITVNLMLALVMVKYYFTLEQANLITSAALSGQNMTGWPMAVAPEISHIKRPAAIDYNEAASLQPTLAASMVLFFRQQDQATTTFALGGLYDLNKPLASGWVVTNDGWVVSSVNLEDWSNLAVINNNHKIYRVNQKTADPLTGLFFYRLAGANNLASIRLGENGWSRPGQLFYNFDSRGGLKAVWLERINNGRDGLSMSSDILWRRWQFSSLWPDSAVFNGQGELFGLADQQGKLAPANYIKSGLINLLAKGNFQRISLGLEYTDLNQLSSERGGLLVNKVAVNSPAAKAGIKVGDVLLSIDEINLNQEVSLNEILQGYRLGERAALIVQRASQNHKLDCQF